MIDPPFISGSAGVRHEHAGTSVQEGIIMPSFPGSLAGATRVGVLLRRVDAEGRSRGEGSSRVALSGSIFNGVSPLPGLGSGWRFHEPHGGEAKSTRHRKPGAALLETGFPFSLRLNALISTKPFLNITSQWIRHSGVEVRPTGVYHSGVVEEWVSWSCVDQRDSWNRKSGGGKWRNGCARSAVT